MPLLLSDINKELKIVKITSNQKTKQHLANLGIIPGSTLEILSKASGNLIVKVLEGRIAIDENLARQIIVM